MTTDVRALVLQRPGELAWESRVCSDPGPSDVVIAPRAIGICGSDLHLYREGRIGDSVVEAPLVLGHEAAGVVVATGSEVSSLRVGDRVIVEPGIACGDCRYCRNGRYNLCSRVQFLGIPPTDGMLADQFRAPARWVYRLPDELSDAQGAMIEPFAVGLQAVAEAGVEPGQTVVILGAGPIGLMILQAARVRGAERVISIDLARPALELADRLGASETISPRETDAAARVRELTDGEGADVVIEAVGATATIRQTLDLVRRGGVITLVGISSEPSVALNVNHLVRRGIHLRTSFRYAHQHAIALNLAAQNRVDLLSPITHRFPMASAVEGFRFVDQHKQDVVKGLIEFAT